MNKRRAFTLIELLVTVALVALLATITAVALKPIRATANRTDSMNALRQMTLGYTAYAADHNGSLMPGYVSAPRLNLLGLNPKLDTAHPLDPGLAFGGPGAADPSDASAYIWRLSPYLDHAWKTMFIDYRSGELVDKLSSEVNRSLDPARGGLASAYGPATVLAGDLGAARAPSFGMNSVFVGGDDVHGGTTITDRNPWEPAEGLTAMAATRLSQAKNPSRLIVFAPSQHTVEYQNENFMDWPRRRETLGSPEVRPPFVELDDSSSNPLDWTWIVPQWRVMDNEARTDPAATFTNGGGMPIARWGGQIPIARLDGSVTTAELERLAFDMRMWSPFQTGDHKVE